MELVFRKIGNSTGLTFPPSFLREYGIGEGQVISLEVKSDGTFILKPKKTRKRYTAKELNALCNFDALMPEDIQEWENAPAVGSEGL
jgi:antitoxin ChpS